MQTRMLAMLAMIGLAGGAVFAQTPSFNPILVNYGGCGVYRPNYSGAYYPSEEVPLTGTFPYIFERSVYMAPDPNGGQARETAYLTPDMFVLYASNETWERSSTTSGMTVRFQPNVTTVDVRVRGSFGVVNWMDLNVAYLYDRTFGQMKVYEHSFTKDQTVRVTLDPTHQYDLLVGTDHNNLMNGPAVGYHYMFAEITLTPAQNWLNGTLNLAQVASPTASDRMVGWQLVQGGSTLASGVFPSMGSQQFRLGVPLSATGPAHVVFDTDTFLRRVVPVTLGAAEINLDPVTLLNGDVDGSHEVDLTDIDLVIAKYLESGWALPEDVDLSGEVDLTDIDIVISNYLAASDPLP